MSDHTEQRLTAREMVRVHAYPVLAFSSSISLLSIAILLIPQAVKTHRYNRCVDAQVGCDACCDQPQGADNPRHNELSQGRGT